jgi:hypothetical protein
LICRAISDHPLAQPGISGVAALALPDRVAQMEALAVAEIALRHQAVQAQPIQAVAVAVVLSGRRTELVLAAMVARASYLSGMRLHRVA